MTTYRDDVYAASFECPPNALPRTLNLMGRRLCSVDIGFGRLSIVVIAPRSSFHYLRTRARTYNTTDIIHPERREAEHTFSLTRTLPCWVDWVRIIVISSFLFGGREGIRNHRTGAKCTTTTAGTVVVVVGACERRRRRSASLGGGGRDPHLSYVPWYGTNEWYICFSHYLSDAMTNFNEDERSPPLVGFASPST
mmetsp:Transcript_28152/g.51293  ORF Transcript_28152/g.51293 Transcript_28152/m.51293 type:complete len:195 (+) Transcript_28152:173-757(+)